MPHIPKAVLEKSPLIPGLELRGRGKVRDAYSIPGRPDLIAFYASDRCSAYDFVLNMFVKFKGQVLTAMSHFWDSTTLKPYQTDFVATGEGCLDYLPKETLTQPKCEEIIRSLTIVRKVEEPRFEDVIRGYLTGSGWDKYQKEGKVCDHLLPPGLHDGSRLPYNLYTPTTKAKEGHDENVDADYVGVSCGPQRERLSLQLYALAAEYALSRGIIIADTKLEISETNGKLIVADEKFTPDSSRFWDVADYEKAQAKGKLPQSLDKQPVRDYCSKAFIQKDEAGRKREPTNPHDLEFVDNHEVPQVVGERTTARYRYILWRMTGMMLERYQLANMGISGIEIPKRRVTVLIGSKNDIPQIKSGIEFLENRAASVSVNVVSCHRNPQELLAFVSGERENTDVFIAGAGMAAALPGIVKSYLCDLKKPEIPVIGVALDGKSDTSNMAAILSIEELPGHPVEMNSSGEAYFGPEGFLGACVSAVNDEFLIRDMEKRSAEFNIKI